MVDTKDVRDEIVSHLKEIERPLTWLAEKSTVPYSTLYSSLTQRLFKINKDNLLKINDALGTDFK